MHGGDVIKNQRIKLGLTQQQVADACGVSKSTVCKWQTGDIGNMRRDRIASLSKILRLSPMEIVNAESPQQMVLSNLQLALVQTYRQLKIDQQVSVNEIILALVASNKGADAQGKVSCESQKEA